MVLPAAAGHFRALLDRQFGPRLKEARVFGSYARGEATEESDLDVFVLVEGLTRDDKIAAMGLASDTMLLYGLNVQSLAMSPEEFARLLELETGIALDIVAEGIAL